MGAVILVGGLVARRKTAAQAAAGVAAR